MTTHRLPAWRQHLQDYGIVIGGALVLLAALVVFGVIPLL
jgi:hypothetical protein